VSFSLCLMHDLVESINLSLIRQLVKATFFLLFIYVLVSLVLGT
jgi:hypothetical protein